MNNHISQSVAVAVCAALLSGCASGPLYPEVKKSGALAPVKGKSLALFYWKPALKGVETKIYANDQMITDSMRRSYFFSYYAEPGQMRLASTHGSGDSKKDMTTGVITGIVFGGGIGGIFGGINAALQKKKEMLVLDVKADQTYYIKMHEGFAREKMELVSPTEGEAGIQKCHWLNPSMHQ